MPTQRFVFLSFDVEEFDLPLEYGSNISMAEQMQTGFEGLQAIMPLLNEGFMETTLFTTANFAIDFPDAVKALANKHEIASHTFYHSAYKEEDLLLSRKKLEEISGKPVIGLRMPRLRKVDMAAVKQAGYIYDSSINPTYLPGRYNNLNLPKTIYNDNGIIRVPTAVSPHLRIPLFWLAFKNVTYSMYRFWALQALKKYGYLSLYFHPWEFINIEKYTMPGYTKKPCGEKLLTQLYRLVNDLKKEADFISIEKYLALGKHI